MIIVLHDKYICYVYTFVYTCLGSQCMCATQHIPLHTSMCLLRSVRDFYFSRHQTLAACSRRRGVLPSRSRRPRHRQIERLESMLRTHCVRCASIIAYADVCARCRTPCHELALSCPGRVIVGREWYAYGLSAVPAAAVEVGLRRALPMAVPLAARRD